MSLLDENVANTEVAETANAANTGQRYWRSLDELENTPQFQEFLHREFPEGASEMLSPFSRRAFLNLMGASIALAGAVTGCRRPENKIVPYSKLPEDMIPGNPMFYATTIERGGSPVGLIVESHEGRPTKIEGNPEHPANLGGVDGQTQGAILELYDPDRSMQVLHNGEPSSLDAFSTITDQLTENLRPGQGEGLYVLGQISASPSFLDVRRRFLSKFPKASWHTWEPINEDNAHAGSNIIFGKPLRPIYDIEKADVILALDSDFLAGEAGWLANTRHFSRRRQVEDGPSQMNRLYAVEGVYSLTGAAADHRLRLPGSQAGRFLMAVAAEIFESQLSPPANDPLMQQLAEARKHPPEERWVTAVANDLITHRGRALVVPGPGQPPAVHALAQALNTLLGSDCIQYAPYPDAGFGASSESIAELTEAMRAGKVKTLVILGGNPVYDAPADLNFGGALDKVQIAIHLGLYANETARHEAINWHVPRAHPLESWGDTLAADGTIGLTQPLIAPLFGGLTDAELVARLSGQEAVEGYEIVRGHHQGSQPLEEFLPRWEKALHDGIMPGQKSRMFTPASLETKNGALAQALSRSGIPAEPTIQSMELVFLPDPKLHDGRLANNGWLQEIPNPVTKIAWDNVAMMSKATADSLKVENERVVALELDGRSVELPAWITPGMADNVVGVHLGYGRRFEGRVAEGVGVDVYPLRACSALHLATGLKVTPTRRKFLLANTQDHWALEGRALVREADVETYREHPDVIKHMGVHGPPIQSPFQEHSYEESPQWGMSIDLSKCIGCNACMVACQAENNIPVVGKDRVREGREMHWIRLDRYYKGSIDDPQMVFEPVPCQQCENAPCEQVCPVGATSHSPDGLNEQTYNRCVGTRYCLNNCPYKVRRFNFFNYHEDQPDLLKMASNPNVTVRMRGVMEKCTYCVQRIRRNGIQNKVNGTPYKDGDVRTACQSACPAEAIRFGDILDENSQVSRAKQQPRNYTLLEEINVKTRTSYLARLRNPNPELKESTETEHGRSHA